MQFDRRPYYPRRLDRMSQVPANLGNRRPSVSRTGPFRLARVEKADMPDGGKGQHWYRYVLDNGRSTITGQRKGSLKDVTAHANRYAEQLNTRTFGSHSVWTS